MAEESKDKTVVKATFPQIYRIWHTRAERFYYHVSTRSKKWGMKGFRSFLTRKEAEEFAEEIEKRIERFGAQKDVPNEKAVMAEAYAMLVERLAPFGKQPEKAVEHYVQLLGNEALRQAKPSIRELVDMWEKEKVSSKIKPLADRTTSTSSPTLKRGSDSWRKKGIWFGR